MLRSLARFRGTATLALLFFLLVGPAAAHYVIDAPRPLYYEWTYDVGGNVDYQFPTGLSGNGRFGLLSFDLGIVAGGPISQNVRLWLDGRYGFDEYRFSERASVDCSCFDRSPWNIVHRVDVAPGAALVLSEALQFVAIVPFRWNGETAAEDQAITAGIIGAVQIRLGERFSALLGAGVQNELESRATGYPVVALDWQISDRLRLRSTGDIYQGGGGELVWGSPDQYEFSLSAGWQRERFRLRSGSNHYDGIGEHSRVPILAGISVHVTPAAAFKLEGGLSVAGRLTLNDKRGNRLDRQTYDTAGRVGGSVEIRF